MKVLFIQPVLPYPLYLGGNQGMYNGIAAVKDKVEAHLIYLEYYNRKNDEERHKLEKLFGNVTISPYVYNHRKGLYKLYYWFIDQIAQKLKLQSKSKDYASDQMARTYKMLPQEYVEYINDYIVKHKIDVVQVEMIGCLSLVLALPATVKKVFLHHELRYIINELALNQMGRTRYRVANSELAKIQEIGLLNRYDAVITVSSIDAQKLKDAGVATVVAPSFSVVNTPPKISLVDIDSHLLTFVGPSSHNPNYVGIMWFLKNCWQKLLAEDGNYRLRIIGRWDEGKKQLITKEYGNRIEFAGFVENLSTALQGSLMIVPITIGSGIRMKILEASSLGVPFVSTTVGAEGLPFASGQECMLADTPEDFVKSILLMRDTDRCTDFAKKANEIVKSHYSLTALGENRIGIYNSL